MNVKENDLDDQRQKEESMIKLIGVIRCWQRTMSTEITWKVVIAVIEGPIVDHHATGMKICEFLARKYNVTFDM